MAAENPPAQHELHFDVAGSGYRRLVCRTCDPREGVLLVDQSAYSRSEFEQMALRFIQDHPPKDNMVPSEDRGVPPKTLDDLKAWLR